MSIAKKENAKLQKKLQSHEFRKLADLAYKKRMIKFQNGCCFYCDCELATFELKHVYNKTNTFPQNYPTFDHYMPIAKGGSLGPENLVVSCACCNNKKGNMHPIDFFELIGKEFKPFVHFEKYYKILKEIQKTLYFHYKNTGVID